GSPAVDGELDQVVVGVAEVDAGRGPACARARRGARLEPHTVLLEQGEYLVDAPLPFEAEVGATDRRSARAEVGRVRRRIRPVDVDLLRVVDPDRRHVGTARALLAGDREADPPVEVERALEITRDDDPVIDALDSHRRPPASSSTDGPLGPYHGEP